MVCLQRSLPWRKPPDPATPSRPSTPVRWLPSVPLNRSPRAMAKPVCSVEQKKKKPEASTHESVNNSSPRRDDGAGEDGGLERRWCFAAGREPPVVPPPRSILFLSRLRRRRPSLSLLCSALLCSSLSPLMRIEEAIQSSNCGGTRKAGAVGSEAFDTWE